MNGWNKIEKTENIIQDPTSLFNQINEIDVDIDKIRSRIKLLETNNEKPLLKSIFRKKTENDYLIEELESDEKELQSQKRMYKKEYEKFKSESGAIKFVSRELHHYMHNIVQFYFYGH